MTFDMRLCVCVLVLLCVDACRCAPIPPHEGRFFNPEFVNVHSQAIGMSMCVDAC